MNRIQNLMNLAEEELLAAQLLFNNNLYRACISRSYYALYHTVQALLSSKNINTRTHRGSIQQFGQYFIKTEELSQELSKILSDTFDLRHLSDYDETVIITEKQSEIILEQSQLFVNEANIWLKNQKKFL